MVQISRSDGSGTIKLVNFALRLLQFIIAIPIIAIYAVQLKRDNGTELEKFFNQNYLKDHNLELALAAGAIGIITAFIYMIMLALLEFKWVCFLCPWDLIVMIVNAAAFGQLLKATHPGADVVDSWKQVGFDKGNISTMQNSVWVILVAMLLWLITFLKGAVCLVFGRFRGSKPVY